jgi:hypothetical protein
MTARFPVFEAIAFPIEPARVEAALRRAITPSDREPQQTPDGAKVKSL